MPSRGEKAVARVLYRLCPLPASPFRRAAAVVCYLNVPLDRSPPLDTLCSNSLTDFSAADGLKFYEAAVRRHPRHQLPFVLSRVAASHAIAALPRTHAWEEGKTVVFTGDRKDARRYHDCELSLSHEDSIAAVVAWTSCAALTAPPSQLPGQVCAVDVCPVSEVHRVRRRFTHLRQRWLPQCVTEASQDVVDAALATVAASPRNCGDGSVMDTSASLTHGRCSWWRQLSPPCDSEAEAYASLVLAQHWGARECAVKLLGVPDRSFPYAALHGDPHGPRGPVDDAALPLPSAFMAPHTLYRGVVTGTEGEVWVRAGRLPVVYLYSWMEWFPQTSGAVEAPFVVVAACCSTAGVSGAEAVEGC